MQKDLTELKRVVYSNLNPESAVEQQKPSEEFPVKSLIHVNQDQPDSGQIIISNPQENQPITDSEVIGESLSLQDNEKEMIRKALNRHRGKRKAAANELGISERTLYRKIKEYNIKQ
jgi:transcriptional regulator with PAS, ATPase and Fis domain